MLAPAIQILSPAIQIDNVTYGHLTGERVPVVLRDFLEQQEAGARQADKPSFTRDAKHLGEIRICLDSSCVAAGSGKVHEALNRAVDETGVQAVVKSVGCSGMSYLAPLVEVALADGISFHYARVQPHDARAIVLRHFKPRQISRKIRSTISCLATGPGSL